MREPSSRGPAAADGPDAHPHRAEPDDASDPVRDPERLHALDASGLLAGHEPDPFDRVARLAARTLRTPAAHVNVITADAEIVLGAAGRGDARGRPTASGLETSFCRLVVARDATLAIADARTDARVRDNPATTAGRVVAYAGAPLRAPAALGGHVLGSVCVTDVVPRSWSEEEIALLEELAGLVTEQITWREHARDTLGAAERERGASERRAAVLAETLERQLAELEAVYAHAGVGLCVIDADLRWVRINDRLAEMNGFPPEAHVGRTVRELLPDLADTAEPVLRRVLDTGEPLLDVEVVGETPARPGEPRVWREHFLPLRDASGRVVGVNVVCEEVTERRRMEAERERLLDAERAARAEAESASRAKTDFLATMSHELRTPLNAISGYTELLEMGAYGPISAAQQEALGRIQRSQRHLLGLIDEVLSFARIEAGAMRYALADVPVAEALATAESLVLPQARARDLTVVVGEVPAGLAARADAGRLQQVLLNLLGNAVKFTEPGGTVAMSCEVASGRVAIQVMDTGIGIPAEKLSAIFEPFVQVEAGLTRTRGGTGLGLAISRDLARGMGGDLTAESTPGVGSTFTLLLPRGRRLREPGA